MTIQEITNELGWVIRPGTRVKIKSFANMIRRINECPKIEAICQTLDKASGIIERDHNGVITINQ